MEDGNKDGLRYNKKSKAYEELVINQVFLSTDDIIKDLLKYVHTMSNEYEDLVPRRNYFPPYGGVGRSPPTMKQ